MLLDTNRPAPAQRGPGTTPDHRREELLNRLCTLREDPRFAEWCFLTSALGLGDLPLGGLVALGDDTAAALFPEVRAAAHTNDGDAAHTPPRALVPRDRAGRAVSTDQVLGTGALPGLPLAWLADGDRSVGAEVPVPFAALDDAAFDGRITHLPTRNGRVG